jgi:RimJ/RimL family protein N-acetyltransferase
VIEYRRIRLTDVDAMAEFALSAIPDEPELAVSATKVVAMVTFIAIHREHFQMAAFKDGIPVAGVAMLVHEMPFHDRGEGSIIFCYATEPGVGYRLLRALIRWVNDDMRVRRVTWSMNRGFDERLRKLARRLGFQSEFPTMMYCKGG